MIWIFRTLQLKPSQTTILMPPLFGLRYSHARELPDYHTSVEKSAIVTNQWVLTNYGFLVLDRAM